MVRKKNTGHMDGSKTFLLLFMRYHVNAFTFSLAFTFSFPLLTVDHSLDLPPVRLCSPSIDDGVSDGIAGLEEDVLHLDGDVSLSSIDNGETDQVGKHGDHVEGEDDSEVHNGAPHLAVLFCRLWTVPHLPQLQMYTSQEDDRNDAWDEAEDEEGA